MLKNITDKLAIITQNAKLHLSYKLNRNLYDTILTVAETFPESFDNKLTLYGLPVYFNASEDSSTDFFALKKNTSSSNELKSVSIILHFLPLVKFAKAQRFSSEKFASWLNAELTRFCTPVIQGTERINSVREEAELFHSKQKDSFAGLGELRLSLQGSGDSGSLHGTYDNTKKVVNVYVDSIARYASKANLDDENLRAYVRAIMAHEYAHAYDSARNPALFNLRQHMIVKSVMNNDLDTYVKMVEALENNAHRFTPKFLNLTDNAGRKEAILLSVTSLSADRQHLAVRLQEFRNSLSSL